MIAGQRCAGRNTKEGDENKDKLLHTQQIAPIARSRQLN
jgi:hypothetical protein